MKNKFKRAGTKWSSSDDKILKEKIKKKENTEQIAEDLERTSAAIRSRVQKLGISLQPKDSPTHKST